MPPFHIDNITLSTFKDVLSRYSATVSQKLRDLDTQRYDTIPAAVAARETKYLTKDEVVKLIEKHGTFRPVLLGLVQSNNAAVVQETTQKAYDALSEKQPPDYPSPLPALKILVGLKGVGPATASLLLSVLRPREIPFFSDELFRWCAWDADRGKDGEGWKRKIKYNIKEYEMVVTKVKELRRRLGEGVEMERGKAAGADLVGWAVHIEKVAWVLGKEGVDIDNEEEEMEKQGQADAEEVQGEDATEEVEEKTLEPAAKKGTKRKAEVKTPAEGTRKSTRTKK